MNGTKQKTWRQNLVRWSPAFLAAVIVLAIVALFTLPPAQALAQDFLGLFRVKKFATITVDPARIKQLNNLNIDPEQLMANDVKVVKEPGKPVNVASVKEASDRVGYAVAVPSGLPADAKLQASVQGEGSVVITADTAKAQEVLDLLAINDVTLPAQLNGAKITINKPALVNLTYTFKNGSISLMQSPSPEVQLPPGVELKQIGEIGLRVLGLSAADARDYADKVDWNTTFLIPVPANAGEVRQVTINGADGLMFTSNGSSTQRKFKGPAAPNGESIILWANNGMVYALHGYGSSVDLLEFANSVH